MNETNLINEKRPTSQPEACWSCGGTMQLQQRGEHTVCGQCSLHPHPGAFHTDCARCWSDAACALFSAFKIVLWRMTQRKDGAE